MVNGADPLAEAKELLQRWIDAWKYGAQRGESTSRLAHESEGFIGRPSRQARLMLGDQFIPIPVDEARALAEWEKSAAMLMPKEALIASIKSLAENLLIFLDGSSAEQAERVGLQVWGSDCVICGNATPGSQTCDSCGSSENTIPLYWDPLRGRLNGG